MGALSCSPGIKIEMTSFKIASIAITFTLASGLAHAAQQALPHNPPALPQLTTLSQLQAGVYHYYENNKSIFKLGKKQGKHYRLANTFTKGTPQQFSYGGSTDHIVRNGQLRNPPIPNIATALDVNRVALQRSGRDDGLVITLHPYDVSGKPIESYLKTVTGRPSKVAQKMASGHRFAQGSVAYIAEMRSLRPEVVVPSTEVITGQKNIANFIKTFSGKIPNCLAYESRADAQPYAIRFVNNKGNSGEIEIYRAKRGEVFCTAEGNRFAKGTYKIQTINGTRVMALDFPQSVDSRDIGIRSSEEGALQLAFVEVKHPQAKVLPGRIVKANRPFTDNQFRFNATAAQSIEKAM